MHVSLSPCVGICRLDDATGYCIGCGRTGDEIAAWSTAGPSGRRAVWAALPARLASLGVGVRRMPWSAADVRGFVIRSLREGRGTWQLAAATAAASFPGAPEACGIHAAGETVEAVTGDAALRLCCTAEVRAFAIDAGSGGAAETIVLAVAANRPGAAVRPVQAAAAPHPDVDAIRPADRVLPLRMLDADGQEAWWGIRERPPGAPAEGPAGVAAPDGDGEVIIATAVGRIEVPQGAARLGEAPAAGELPEGFVAAAVFSPRL